MVTKLAGPSGALYVPRLWAKKGELDALKELGASQKQKLLPLFDVPPIPWDHDNDCPKKTIDKHLEGLPKRMLGAVGIDVRSIIDLEWLGAATMANGDQPTTAVFEVARESGLQLVPAVTLVKTSAYLSAVAAVVRKDGRGVCLRLTRDDLADQQLTVKIRARLKDLGTSAQESDVLIDLGAILDTEITALAESLSVSIEDFPFLMSWRSFTLASSAFPDTLGNLPQLAISKVKRSDWALWKELRQRKRLRRIPTFGDYGVSGPAPPYANPKHLNPSANIRYTTGSNWLVAKGRSVREHGFGQFHGLSRELIKTKEYTKNTFEFSWGDRYVYLCGQRGSKTGPGSLTTWRQVGTSHHLSFVLKQIASAS